MSMAIPIYEVLDGIFVLLFYLCYILRFIHHAKWQRKVFTTVSFALIISVLTVAALAPRLPLDHETQDSLRWFWKAICLWSLSVIEATAFSQALETSLVELEGSLGLRCARWIPFLDEFTGLHWVRWMGPRWVRLMIFVECPEAIASAILLRVQVDITALPPITTHIAVLVIVAKYHGMMRSAAKDLEEQQTVFLVSVDVEKRRKTRKRVMRLLSITVGAVVASVALFFVSALGIYHHFMFLQAGISAVVISKGHLRKHLRQLWKKILELQERLHPGPTDIELPSFQTEDELAFSSTTCLISPLPVYIAQ
ncbi:hypothetical protein B0J13DRAFT_547176 [Dactylonectria estremocensis]|uniref:Uncharacterized protein n=1 Tax=Dactylonectria estremocensis TaxID=1079267 RepID=A0A9P9JCC2_9HYPO|nr:hypothetical protein B0J13DRAFT_547176 [Dactylonectria estremocensis]